MTRTTYHLNPERKLVDEVADWLCQRVRTDASGARSLAHLMVVVPTAQSGRSLRLTLARRAAAVGWGGMLPPLTVMQSTVLQARGMRIATEAEELAAMAQALSAADLSEYPNLFPKAPAERGVEWALEMSRALLDVLSILGENAMMMCEVKSAFDAERWEELAHIEEAFISILARHGATARVQSRRKAAETGCSEVGIEEIVLPAAVDIQGAFISYLEHSRQPVSLLIHAETSSAAMFDEWGRPKVPFSAALKPSAIMPAPTAVVEADDIARHFRAVGDTEALPALAVCDAEMYPELEGAFQNHFAEDELALRNPARTALATSPLGRILACILQLERNGDYETFSTFARSGDVARWAADALGVSRADIARYVGALDAVQNAHLPRTIDEVIRGAAAEAQTAWGEDARAASAGLVRLAEAIRSEISAPFTFLRKLFAGVSLDERNPSDRELIAAAETVRELREACASELIPERMRATLFGQLLKRASYMLEPLAPNVLATNGWLEIPWCAEDELVIAGFNEGCVPENVVGHPFVPDSLREALGLTTNAKRALRDSFIFAEAVACRRPGAVTVHLHQIAGDRNVMKPSRILFNGICDDDLPGVALRLYAVTKGNEGAPPKELPPAWRLALPIPPPGVVFRERISPTALDQYLKCPFSFYLQEVFGEHADDRNQELDNLAFGTLCHAALDEFGKSGVKDSTDADEIADFLADAVRHQLKAFGANLPAIIELQGEAAIERLGNFAVHQARRRTEGWRIIASEQSLSCRIKQCPTLLRGKVDRIDEHERTGELAIIDYKTWNRADVSKNRSLQLPIYRAMVEASGLYDKDKAHTAKAFYCVLAERAEDVMFDEQHAFHEGGQADAETNVVELLTNMAKGIFYPPQDTDWMKVYGPLVWGPPDKGIDPAWIADQQSRMHHGEVAE